MAERAAHGQTGDEYAEPIVNIDMFSGPVVNWIQTEVNRNEVKRLFRQFIINFRDENHEKFYQKRIALMCSENRKNLDVSYNDIGQCAQNIAIWLADHPIPFLEILDEVALKVTEELFPNYKRICDEIHVRITDLPIDDHIRELREMHLSKLIRVSGVVTRRTDVFPQLKVVKFNCVKCNQSTVPILHKADDRDARPPARCSGCDSSGPFRINQEQTIYRNFQRITLQESPGSVPAGRVPRSKEVILVNDLIDCCRPGEEIEITGVYKNQFDTSLNTRNGFPVFSTIIEANYVRKSKDVFNLDLTDEDILKIREYSSKPNIYEILVNSIAPSIHGHRDIKSALALSLFGGTQKNADKGRHRLRGDINVLILGDPGTAKSQFLKYTQKIAPRAVYATGKGASSVGLTASVQKDPITRE